METVNEELQVQAEELQHQTEEFQAQAEELELQNEELERLSQELEAERALLRTVLDQMPGGVIIAAAPSGRLLLANAQMEAILGHPVSLDRESAKLCFLSRLSPQRQAFRTKRFPPGPVTDYRRADQRRGD